MRPDFQAYISQFRALSEVYWSSHVEQTLEEFQDRGIGGATWAAATRWKPGMAQAEIDSVEAAFGAPFPDDYRAFLSILNAPNKPAHWFLFEGAEIKPAPDRNIFTDWSTMADAKRAEQDLISGILFDVEHCAIWEEEWGERPSDPTELATHVAELVANAPKLIPLHSHRFLVAELDLEPAPVLSIMQSDAIFYTDSIEQCLATDFPNLAPGLEPPMPKVDTDEYLAVLRAVPFWGPMIA